MSSKTTFGYLSLLGLSFFLHATMPGAIYFVLLPILMIIFPILVRHKVKMTFSIKHFSIGIAVSLLILLPYCLRFGGPWNKLTDYALLVQLLTVSFSEEFFFRGFLQESIGKDFRAVLLTSLSYSIAHLPKAVYLGDWFALLSFFPSVIMGLLYLGTNNILPGFIFNFLASLVYYR